MAEYRTKDGQEILLKQRLDFGGEGAVWLTNFPDILAKIYHNPPQGAEKKLQSMIDNPPEDRMLAKGHRSIAWPQDLLFNEHREVQGFLMPRVSGALKLNHIYNPKLRRKNARGFTWYYLHGAALNVASILASLHEKNYVVGDLKTDNFLVTDRALVSILDTDSFQIQSGSDVFLCPVGSEGFTPPELLGCDFEHTSRAAEQDAFGLAILVHLILLGYHPFSGEFKSGNPSASMTRDESVEQGLSPYHPDFEGGLPPYAPAPEVLHPKIKAAFVQCFGPGLKDPEARPTAQAWCDSLQEAMRELKQCLKAPQHFHFGETCLWCSRAEALGYDFFPKEEEGGTLSKEMQFQKALNTKDLREISRLWHEHKALADNPRFEKYRDLVQQSLGYVGALDHFKAFCEQAKTDEEILVWWLDHEALSYFPHNTQERIQGRPLHEFIKEVRERIKALEGLRKAIDAADKTDKFGTPLLHPELEREIIHQYRAYAWTQAFRDRNPKVFARVEEAIRCLDIWEQFQALRDAHDDRAGKALLEKKGAAVNRFALSDADQNFIKRMVDNAKKSEELKALVSQGAPFDTLLEWWAANPRFAQSSFKEEVVGGFSLEEHRMRAEQQKTLLAKMQESVDQGDFLKLATLWDASLCEGCKAFLPFATLAHKAQEKDAQWQRVRRAALEDDIQAVVADWDEESFYLSAQREGLVPQVQKAFREVYADLRFPKSRLTHMERHRDFLHLRWVWPANVSDDLACAIRQGGTQGMEKEPAEHVLMVRKKGKMGMAQIPWNHKVERTMEVWAGQVVCGTLLFFGKPLKIFPEKCPKIMYTVEVKKPSLWERVRKGKAKVIACFESDQDVVLPALFVKGITERPPTFHDKGARTLVSIPAFSLEAGKRHRVSLNLESMGAEAMFYRVESKFLEGEFELVDKKGYEGLHGLSS